MRVNWILMSLLLVVSTSYGQKNTPSLWVDIAPDDLKNKNLSKWIVPDKYRSLSLETPLMKSLLAEAPSSDNPNREVLRISIPMPDLTNQTFEIVEHSIMEPGLAAVFPEIKTYQGRGIEDPSASIVIDMTPQGFHAMISGASGTIFIDPYARQNNQHYLSYYKKHYHAKAEQPLSCGLDLVEAERRKEDAPRRFKEDKEEQVFSNRAAISLSTYRLAVAATGEYTAFHGGTQAAGQAAIVTAINRVNLLYRDELAVEFVLVSGNQNLVYTNSGTDPYTNNNGSTMLSQNQTTIDNIIGSGNYDVGHVFSTGGGGVAFLGVICENGNKARGVTGLPSPTGDPFYIDFVAHEIGHQFGGNHTFNGTAGSCGGGNRNGSTAYEPGSGSTIQAYSGICTSQNLQNSADPYYHIVSLLEMRSHVTNQATCAVTSGANNTPVANANKEGINGKSIPISTPFELTGEATDADGDGLLYSWEQWDLGTGGNFSSTTATGPIFRSFTPTSNPTRTFPQISDIISNSTTYGEVLPSVARTLNFQFIARDDNAIGGFDSDQITLNVVAGAGPFVTTNLNTGGTFSGSETITWNVSGTTGNGINCATVDVYLSTDGGQTFPTLLANDTPNDGSVIITLPEVNVTTARLKIKCSDNVFFDISDANFSITPTGSTSCTITAITANPSACNDSNDTYTADISVTFTDAPSSGNLVVNNQNFAIGTSPQTVTLTNLTADGNAVNVSANFSDNVSCTLTSNNLFTAPAACMPVCAITNISAGSQTACDVNNDTYTQVITVTYEDQPASGNLVINGQSFTITGSPQTETLSNLAANGNAVNVTASFSENTGCSQTVNALFTAPAACAPVCSITGVSAGTQTACVAATNTYTQAITVTYENPPASGNLVINGQSFAITSSPQTETLVGLVANNSAVNVAVNFSDKTDCSITSNSLFFAPASCAPICGITSLTAGTTSTCDPGTNTYTQTITVAYVNPPNTGNLVINGQSFAITGSPQTETLINLSSNGSMVDVTANFSADTDCAFTQNNLYTAPVNCAPVCVISSISAGTQSACEDTYNTYDQELIITYATPPDRGRLVVNGQGFSITGSPQAVTLSNLPSNGSSNNVSAFFSRDRDCALTQNDVFTAPAPCAPVCVITDLSTGTQTACDPSTNYYNQEVIVTYSNEPSRGRLVVAGQDFPITGSPQTVNLMYLESNGESVEVTAWFSRKSDCYFTKANLFTAPAACIPICDITSVTTGVQSACDPNSNSYTQELIITYENAPDRGRLVVNGQRFSITGSPQTITLDYLEADGDFVDLEVYFSTAFSCDFILEDAFSAPAACIAVCAITDVSAGNQGACNSGSNEYTQEVIVTYENAPSGGRLLVNGQRFSVTSSPQTVILTDLEADGQAVDIQARFSWDFDCAYEEETVFTAPNACQQVCEISDITTGTQTACNASTNSYTQEIMVTYANAPTEGNLIVNGQWFAIETSPQTIVLENLESDGGMVNINAKFSKNAACTFSSTNVFTAPASCAPVCAISAISAGTQGACDPTRNEYTQEVIVTYVNPPTTGRLIVHGQVFEITASPQTVTLTELRADGQAVEVEAYFSRDRDCGLTQSALFTAPAACEASCAITALAAGAQGACNANDNTYTQEVTITYANAPLNGKLIVNGQRFTIGTSPQTVTLTNLIADAQAVEVTAFFSKKRDCTFTQASLFTAPSNCAPLCIISALSLGTQGVCNVSSNTYTQEIVVTYENPPSRGKLIVHGAWFPITASPQTVTLEYLEADGQAVDITATFSASDNCSFTQNSLFTAPNPCIPICSITNLTAGTQSACNTTDNTFTQEIIVTYENAPNRGKLIVNGQRFLISESPQTITLEKLQASGNMLDVQAYFSRETSCTFTATDLISTPEACLTTVCGAINSTDTPIAISSNGSPLISSTIAVNVTGKVTDVNIMNLTGTHTWTSDLVFTLTSPSGTSVTLLAHACEDMDDFNISFDDDALAEDIPCPLTDGNTYRPEQLLSKFIGEDPLGNWTLKVRDHFNEDGGSLTGWTLEVCTNQSNGSCNMSNLEVHRDSIYDGDYISNERIRSSGRIRSGAKVMYKSGESITLEGGFAVSHGSDFTAMIDGCNTAGRLAEDMDGILYKTEYVSTKPTKMDQSTFGSKAPMPVYADDLKVFPNPFKGSTQIAYTLKEATTVSIKIVHLNGQVLGHLVTAQHQEKGAYQLRIAGNNLTEGLYLLQFQTASRVVVKQLVVLE